MDESWQLAGRLNPTTNLLLLILLLRQVHIHGEDEGAALVLAFGLNRDFTSAILNYPLANHQTDADAFPVQTDRPLNFAEHAEELLLLEPTYADTRISYMHNQLFIGQVVRGFNADLAAQRKLKRVLGQIDQDLFQAYLVSHKLVG